MDLAGFVGGSVFAFLLVFVRVGAAFLIMPAIGEAFVSTRIRLLFALLVALVVAPLVGAQIPAQPAAPAPLLLLILGEVLVGLFIGTIARTMLSAMETAGFLISQSLGLSAAQAFNPALAAPGNPAGALLGMVAVLVIFSTDMHHMLILAVVDSYTLFLPGQGLPMGDASEHIVRVFSKSFLVGVQLAAPFLVIGMLFFLGLGLVARLVPQIQVFFIGLPIQIIVGMFLFGFSLTAIMTFWLRSFEEQLIVMLRP